MIYSTISLVIFTIFIVTSPKNESYEKLRKEYFHEQHIKEVRDSIQADMKYRHDSIEIEYYKQHIKN